METERTSTSKTPKIESGSEGEEDKEPTFKAFTGQGYSLNGKTISNGPPNTAKAVPKKKVESSDSESEEEEKPKKFVPFGGSGHSLRKG